MPNPQEVQQLKERILSFIQSKGPSLPVQIARAINVSPLFASVFLSELCEDDKLTMSGMKVGSSSLFYIKGQEVQLENFVEHLNPREKEAFFLLKKELVLEDDKQTPITRVALRAIKDFALPVKINTNNQTKLFWKYAQLPESELTKKIESALEPQKKLAEPQVQEEPQVREEPKAEKKPKEKKKTPESNGAEFIEKLKEHFNSRNIEILETLLEKKKEGFHKVRISTPLGMQGYYSIAKDKKKVTDVDLTLALQKAQSEKMPALFLAPGDLDKKAQNYLNEWKNLIKFEKINL